MAYEPTNWKTGDVVTSAKLNKLENGVANAGGGGVLVVNMDNDTNVLDKTWQEIHDAANGGSVVMMKRTNADGVFFYYLSEATQDSTDYCAAFYLSAAGDPWQGWIDSASGYPVMDQ